MTNAADRHADSPHPIDRHVGLRIRMRRKELRLSQEGLAEALELTFQQVQKYERGVNRVSASRLWEIARALNVGSPAYFFDGLDQEEDAMTAQLQAGRDLLLTPEGQELVRILPKVNRSVQRKVLELVHVLVATELEAVPEAAE